MSAATVMRGCSPGPLMTHQAAMYPQDQHQHHLQLQLQQLQQMGVGGHYGTKWGPLAAAAVAPYGGGGGVGGGASAAAVAAPSSAWMDFAEPDIFGACDFDLPLPRNAHSTVVAEHAAAAATVVEQQQQQPQQAQQQQSEGPGKMMEPAQGSSPDGGLSSTASHSYVSTLTPQEQQQPQASSPSVVGGAAAAAPAGSAVGGDVRMPGTKLEEPPLLQQQQQVQQQHQQQQQADDLSNLLYGSCMDPLAAFPPIVDDGRDTHLFDLDVFGDVMAQFGLARPDRHLQLGGDPDDDHMLLDVDVGGHHQDFSDHDFEQQQHHQQQQQLRRSATFPEYHHQQHHGQQQHQQLDQQHQQNNFLQHLDPAQLELLHQQELLQQHLLDQGCGMDGMDGITGACEAFPNFGRLLDNHFVATHAFAPHNTNINPELAASVLRQVIPNEEELVPLPPQQERLVAPPEITGNFMQGQPLVEENLGLRLVHRLLACAEAISCNDPVVGSSILPRLLDDADPYGDPMQRIAVYFGEALRECLEAFKYSKPPTTAAASSLSRSNSSSSSSRLQQQLSKQAEQQQQQQDQNMPGSSLDHDLAYQAMYQVLPFIKFSQFTANQAILDAVGKRDRIHIVDLDIQQGLQWPGLIQSLAVRAGGPPAVSLTGVGTDAAVLAQTGRRLTDFATSLRVPLAFQAVPLDRFDDLPAHLYRLAAAGAAAAGAAVPNGDGGAGGAAQPLLPHVVDCSNTITTPTTSTGGLQPPPPPPAATADAAVAVNCPAVLHRLLHADGLLDAVLRAVQAALRPAVVTLLEVEGNHNSDSFFDRFVAALHYYSAMFDSLEATLERDSTERLRIESLCLANDIRNILACDGPLRTARHVRTDAWRATLHRAGFAAKPLSNHALYQAKLLLGLYSSSSYKLTHDGYCATLGWHDTPIVSVSSWYPTSSTSAATAAVNGAPVPVGGGVVVPPAPVVAAAGAGAGGGGGPSIPNAAAAGCSAAAAAGALGPHPLPSSSPCPRLVNSLIP